MENDHPTAFSYFPAAPGSYLIVVEYCEPIGTEAEEWFVSKVPVVGWRVRHAYEETRDELGIAEPVILDTPMKNSVVLFPLPDGRVLVPDQLSFPSEEEGIVWGKAESKRQQESWREEQRAKIERVERMRRDKNHGQ